MSANFSRCRKQVSNLSPMALRLLSQLSRCQPLSNSSSEAGLSLIECLVAIVVIALTAVAITPPIMLATATRIQTRKAEQAQQVAQGEIDRVRLMMDRGTFKVADLPISTGDNSNIEDVAAADASTATVGSAPMISPASCSPRYPINKPTSINSLVLVDKDGDCQPEFMMQVYRTEGQFGSLVGCEKDADNACKPFAFDIGVRVYAWYGNQTPTLLKEKTSLIMGAGPKDKIGGTNRRAMAALYSTMFRSDSTKSLDELCAKLGGSNTVCRKSS